MDERLVGAITLPDGTAVRGRGRREPPPAGPAPQFGLYIGRPPGPASGWSWPAPDWPAEWVDWPDFGTPRDDDRAAAAIVAAYRRARAGERVEVACGGGVGRTGTVIACMAVLAGYPAADAIGWTRRHYRRRAVETPGQRRWIAWFAARHGGVGAPTAAAGPNGGAAATPAAPDRVAAAPLPLGGLRVRPARSRRRPPALLGIAAALLGVAVATAARRARRPAAHRAPTAPTGPGRAE